tara:strand:+ start:7820 stop:9190 length:1371 start_codon:yes stop_codon:yes gene_type:complete
MQIKNICCIGAGYVGGPTMAVIALKCPHIKVTVVDLNAKRIAAWNGPLENLPIYEPGLEQVVAEARGKNLFFSTEVDQAIDSAEMIFMAVNTPTKTEGEGAGMAADLRYVEACAKNIARVAKTAKIIIEKSTLPVRTAEKIKEILDKQGNQLNFEILSNPEFLAEGTAIQDLFKSDRVLIGGDQSENGQKAVKALVDIYANWIPKEKILTTNVWSSELAKLASNAMLAQRISSINSLSAICEKTGANINELSKAIGMDHRIGPKFLKASVGFGGSCFQKDILNLVYLSRHYGLEEVAEYWHQVIKINDYQKNRFTKKIIDAFDESEANKGVTLLGWAFKSKTNDSRESPSIHVAHELIQLGFKIDIYDPKISKEKIISDLTELWKSKLFTVSEIIKKLKQIQIHPNGPSSFKHNSLIAILTEWEEFKKYNWKSILKTKKVFDGRNILKNSNYTIGI